MARQIDAYFGGVIGEAISIATSREKLKQLIHAPLYANAIYLMATSASTAVLGFVFWILVARFYTPEAVGLGSAAAGLGPFQ